MKKYLSLCLALLLMLSLAPSASALDYMEYPFEKTVARANYLVVGEFQPPSIHETYVEWKIAVTEVIRGSGIGKSICIHHHTYGSHEVIAEYYPLGEPCLLSLTAKGTVYAPHDYYSLNDEGHIPLTPGEAYDRALHNWTDAGIAEGTDVSTPEALLDTVRRIAASTPPPEGTLTRPFIRSTNLTAIARESDTVAFVTVERKHRGYWLENTEKFECRIQKLLKGDADPKKMKALDDRVNILFFRDQVQEGDTLLLFLDDTTLSDHYWLSSKNSVHPAADLQEAEQLYNKWKTSPFWGWIDSAKGSVRMKFLYLLEGIRNPVLDGFFSAVTYLGDEIAFMVAALVVFWCVNKYMGFYVLCTGFIGTMVNQFLKMLFRIPRPWVLDPEFTIVESAREAATGWSFPSGHAQSSVGTFGGIARFTKNKWVRVLCIAAAVLVPLSRMYLGVHTPMDVGVSVVIALALIFLLYPLFRRMEKQPGLLWLVTGIMGALSVAFLLFAELYPFPADADTANLSHGVENAYTMLGCVLGLAIALALQKGMPRFDEKAPLLGQVLKVAGGLVLLLALKEGLKPVMALIFGGHPAGRAVRYCVIVVFAAWLWPMTFPMFGKLGRK